MKSIKHYFQVSKQIIKNKIYHIQTLIQANKARHNYKKVIKSFKGSKTKIRFAAYVVFDSSFGAYDIINRMLSNKSEWSVKIVIIPDVSRGDEHLIKTYESTRAFFVSKYGEEYVVDGYNIETGEFYDHTRDFDVIYYCNPYDLMVHKLHSIEYGSKQNTLPIYISYGFDIGYWTTLWRLIGRPLNFVYKCYTDTVFSFNDYKKYQILKGKNVVLSGYSKMDSYAKYPNKLNSKKRVLISPHHTVGNKWCNLPLSNFLSYYDMILELPDLFPNMCFVFRPHPLLFTSMINDNHWTSKQVDEYINQINKKGIEYSTDGDYLNVFSECDAIIHDCGSFTVEWLFTGKPGCFVYNPDLSEEHMTPLMQEALKEYDIARSREDIIAFVRKIEQDNAEIEYVMDDWVREKIAINYPNASQFIVDDLRKSIMGRK